MRNPFTGLRPMTQCLARGRRAVAPTVSGHPSRRAPWGSSSSGWRFVVPRWRRRRSVWPWQLLLPGGSSGSPSCPAPNLLTWTGVCRLPTETGRANPRRKRSRSSCAGGGSCGDFDSRWRKGQLPGSRLGTSRRRRSGQEGERMGGPRLSCGRPHQILRMEVPGLQEWRATRLIGVCPVEQLVRVRFRRLEPCGGPLRGFL